MRRYVPILEVAALLLCAALIAGCASTNTGSGTPTPTSSTTATTVAIATMTSTATATPAATGTAVAGGPVNGSITGTKFNDLNGDHRRDPGDPGLSGWTIILELQEQNGPNWNEVSRTTTDGMGAYAFSNLSEGHYRVSESVQQGWTQTFPTNSDGTTDLVISNGHPFWDGIDFGNFGGPAATGSAGATVTGTATATTATGTATTTSATTAATTAGAVTISLTAQNIAFSMSTITVPAGSTVTVTFNNMDAGVPHNFAVYTDSSATTMLFRGTIVTGPTTTTYTFMAPSTAGTYYFRCDVHPTQMNGQFIVT